MLRSYTYTSASMPIAMNAAFIPTTPPPMTITFAAATPGTPPSRMPRPPSGFSSMKAPAWVLDGLVGHAGRAGVHEALRELGVGREVQVGEQRVARLEQRDLRRLRLLDLDDHVGGAEDGLGPVEHLGSLGRVIGVGDGRALARAGLDDDLVA